MKFLPKCQLYPASKYKTQATFLMRLLCSIFVHFDCCQRLFFIMLNCCGRQYDAADAAEQSFIKGQCWHMTNRHAGTAAKNRQLQQQFVFVQLADSSVISSICQLSLWFVIHKEVEAKSTLHTQNLLLVPMNCQKKNNKPASKKPFLKVHCVLVSISLQTSYFVRNEIQVCSIWNCS